MNRYPLSHVVRMQRVNRIRAPWLQRIGLEIVKLERVARVVKKGLRKGESYYRFEMEDCKELWEALKEAEHLLGDD